MNNKNVINIAYAEDHILVRAGIKLLLESYSDICVTIEANNGLELIAQLEKTPTMPDIIMLDIKMKDMNGFETVSCIRKRWQDMKVLILTSAENEMQITRLIWMGVNGYLLKSCCPDDIHKAVHDISETGYHYSDILTEIKIKNVLSGKIRLPNFSCKEITLLKYCATDLSYAQIATEMHMGEKALDSCRTRICNKLNIEHRNRIALALYAHHLGLVQLY